MDDNKFLPKLSQNLLEILDDDKYYDINIEVGDNSYVKIFRAHMVILNYRSSHLRKVLLNNKKKNDGTLVHIKFSNILPEIFQIILRYIYGGRLSLKEYETSDIIKILLAASELNIHELIIYIQSFLIKNKRNWMEQNFDFIYKTSFENDSLLELQKYCTDLISKEQDKLFKSPNFSLISEKLLVSLIQNDNLQIKLWDHMIKWDISQNSDFSSNSLIYSNDDFKSTLQQCIPSIKFYNLTSKEFLDELYPYKKIIPEELLKFFLNNNDEPSNKLYKLDKLDKSEPKLTKEISLKSNIDSKIITFQHAELISKWIDGLKFLDEIKYLYEFKLILRGSRDGFTPEKFHEICDNQSRTVSIIKVKYTNEILGGYNPIIWKSQDYDYAKDSFIFSFKNDDNIENHILSRVRNEYYAINNCSNLGPSFGLNDLILTGSDFNNTSNNNNTSYCRKISYFDHIRDTDDCFSVEEFEVFQIINY